MDNDLKVNMNEYLPLGDTVLSAFKQTALKGELAPGERLMKIQLVRRLRVSRTLIREAIRKLELEGLVLMIPGEGAEVARILEKSLRDVLKVCRFLKELAIELACQKMGGDKIEQLEEAQLAFREAVSKGDTMTVVESDEAHRDAIYYGTDNVRLIQILNSLREQMYRYRLEYIKDTDERQVLLIERGRILKVIRGRHVAKAKETMREHTGNQEITISRSIEEKE